MKRLLISAMESGSGKTVMTCGLLTAFRDRGLRIRAFKCGPDYLDPLFHSRILGIPCRNLDLFLQGKDAIRQSLDRAESGAIPSGSSCAGPPDLDLIEGAMGYYDGIGGTEENSAWEMAAASGAGTILILRPRGQSLTLAAQVSGLLRFRPDSRIRGLLLTGISAARFPALASLLERETGLPVLGYLPSMEEARFPSRHLGLTAADRIPDLIGRFQAIAAQLERTADLDALLALSEERDQAESVSPVNAGSVQVRSEASVSPGDRANPENSPPLSAPAVIPSRSCRIAVARDEAFFFYYADSLEALRRAGVDLAFFSPLRDSALPPETGGLYLGGGYPELYAQILSGNHSMRRTIRETVRRGIPTVAECGGFLYLQETLRDPSGTPFPMAGALKGTGFPTGKPQRFGYWYLTAETDSLLFRRGERIPVHEFHHWGSTEEGTDLLAQRPFAEESRRCGFAAPTLYAGFPHLHLGGRLPLAARFAEAVRQMNPPERAADGRRRVSAGGSSC